MPLKVPKCEPDIGDVYLLTLSFVTVARLTAAAGDQTCPQCSARNSAAARKLGKIFQSKMAVKSNEEQHHLYGSILFSTKNTILSINEQISGQLISMCDLFLLKYKEFIEVAIVS